MTEQPKISVFMPTYNHESFISEAIESVMMQDYDNIELVICDDASTDNTALIVRDYSNRFSSKVKAIFNTKNNGITPTCNKVLQNCTGKYVVFFSGDDLFLPGKIQKQVNIMESDDSIILTHHNVEIFDSDTDETLYFWKKRNSPLETVKTTEEKVGDVLEKTIETLNCLIAGMSVMIRRDIIPKDGYDERIQIASDWFFWIQLLAEAEKSKKVVRSEEVLSRYRRHGGNITNEPRAEEIFLILALTEFKYPHLIYSVRKAKALLNFRRGKNALCEGDVFLGRKLLIASLRDAWLGRKWIRWFLASYIQRLRHPH